MGWGCAVLFIIFIVISNIILMDGLSLAAVPVSCGGALSPD